MLAFAFMDIHTAAGYMKHGYRVRRPGWKHTYDLDMHVLVFVKLSLEDLLATDWELITEGIIKDFPVTYSD